MSETSIFKKEFGLFCILLQFFHFLFFFLISQPLYFSYCVFFFFSYFLKLLAFLSPLFISTFLLFSFFSLFLSSSSHSVPHFADSSEMGFLAATLRVAFDCLRKRTPEEIEEFCLIEVLEAYKIMFETCSFGSEQNQYGGEDSEFAIPEVEVKVDFEESVQSFPGKIDCEESVENFPEIILDIEVDSKESMGNFPGKILEMKVDCEESMENFPGKILDVEIDSGEYLENPLVHEIEAKTEEFKEAKIEKTQEIRVPWIPIENETQKHLRKLRKESSISSRSASSPWISFGREYNSLRSYGSMREEKEWGSTLASKLFEDRNDSEGTEVMDSLWETYEKIESKKIKKINGKSKRGKKIEDEDGDVIGEGKLCCLQALKFSSKKMNLLKMSKALKGFGLFRKRSLIR